MGSAGEGTGDRHQISDGVGQEEKAERPVCCACFCVVLSGSQTAFGSGNDLESREMVR